MIATIIIMLYVVVLLAISYFSTKKMSSGDQGDFILAGRNLTWPLIGVTIAGLGVGGASTIGVAESAYTLGMSAGWYDVAWATGALAVGLLIAFRIRQSRVATVIQGMEIAYGPVTGFVVMLLQMVVGFGIFTMQIKAGGALLAALLPEVFTINFGMLVSTAIFLVVAIVGGMWSAAMTNIINVIVILAGMIFGAVMVVNHFGGFAVINSHLPAVENNLWWSLTEGYGIPKIIAQVLSLTVLPLCLQTVTQSAASAVDEKHASKGMFFAAILMAPLGFICALFGVIAAAEAPNLESASLAMPMIITYLNPWVSGIILSGLWAADVSTGNGCLIGQATMATQDIVVRYFAPNLSGKKQITAMRIIMVIFSAVGYLFAVRMGEIVTLLMKLLTLWTPLAVVIVVTWRFPKYTRRSTGAVTLLAGGIFGIASLVFPAIVIMKQEIFGTLLVSVAAWLLTVLLDKRPCNWVDMYPAGTRVE